MGMYLASRKDEELNINMPYGYWASTLELARDYGWEPAGTLLYDWCNCEDGESPELIESWEEMEYFTSDNQTVSAVDAGALANALEAAIQDVPAKLISSDLLAGLFGDLKTVVALCRAGEFRLG